VIRRIDRVSTQGRRVAAGLSRRQRALRRTVAGRVEPRWRRLRKKHEPEVNIVYARPLSTTAPPAAATGPFSLVPADKDNLARLKETYPRELSDRKYGILRHRVQDAAEDVWLIVDDDGDLCGFACLAWQDHEIRLMRHWVRVRPHQALFMDDYVFRKHRKRGAHTASVAQRIVLAAERGRTEGLVLVDVRNIGSTTSYRTLGFTPIGRLVHLPGLGRTVELRRPRRRA
jgi:hypothetical protein